MKTLIAISIHALRGEGDSIFADRFLGAAFYFNPRPPWGGRLDGQAVQFAPADISIHALRGEGDFWRQLPPHKLGISIHALRGEGDFKESPDPAVSVISIHALRGEGDANIIKAGIMQSVFQSTPSVGRATIVAVPVTFKLIISIHALRGEGDYKIYSGNANEAISIHALRGEGDGTS